MGSPSERGVGAEYDDDALLDLVEIAAYTSRTWDLQQAERYLQELESTCSLLGEPLDGPLRMKIFPVPERPRLHRVISGSHHIYFRKITTGAGSLSIVDVIIVRVHESMDPLLHLPHA